MQIEKFTEEFADYLRDESRTIGHADYICFPKSEEEIRDTLVFCYQNNLNVTLQGGNTGLAAGAVPNGGLILNCSRMKSMLREKKEENRWKMTYEPGILLAELREDVALRHPGYFFPPDPTETSASLGGMVSCNASGACSFMYGSTRNYICGLKMLLLDGRSITIKRGQNFAKGYEASYTCDDGSTLIVSIPSYTMPNIKKNTAGFYAKKDMDLIDLLIGSDGTLGVFAEIEVEVIPKPNCIQAVLMFFKQEKSALTFVDDFRYRVSNIAAIEFFNEDTLLLIKNRCIQGLISIPENVNAAVYVEIQANCEDEVYESLDLIDGFFTKYDGDEKCILVADTSLDIQKMKDFRHTAPESTNLLIDYYRKFEPKIAKMGADLSVPDDKLFEALEMFESTLKVGGFKSAIWAHIGNNHFHPNIISRTMDEYEAAHKLFRTWAKNIVAMGGTVSAEHGVGKLKADYINELYSLEQINEMREIKRVFDSKYLLNVGNIFPKI